MMLVELFSETEFLDIYLTTFFRVSNFGNTFRYEAHFFLENLQNLILMTKCKNAKKKKKIGKKIVSIKKGVLVMSSQYFQKQF